MASIEDVRRVLLKVTKDLEKAHYNAVSGALPAIPVQNKKSAFLSFESRLMNSFHVGDPAQNQINIAKFVIQDTGCQSCVVIRVLEHHLFRIYFRGTTPCVAPETYNLDDFTCLQTIINKKEEVIQSDEDYNALSLLVQWKPLFSTIPDVVLAIPILKLDQKVVAVVALGFKKKLPMDFMTNKMPGLRDFLDTVVPYAMTIQTTIDYDEECSRMKLVLESLDVIDKDKRDPTKCAISIGNEIGKLTGCQTIWTFTVDYVDSTLQKVNGSGKSKGAQWGCPQSDAHDKQSIKLDDKFPVGWAALHRKPIRINETSECLEYNLTKKGLHSAACCLCKNILCVPVNDHSGERTLVVEVSDKEGGFTSRDLEIASLFAQNAASVYSCCVMLTHRQKSSRRNSMLSQILLNIEPVKHMKVEQFLSHQRRNSQVTLYSGLFLEFHFSIKNYSEWDMSGGILFAFTDLDMISTFKIRRATLIRFILSAQQGYRGLPYHNWQHACSVAHFGYLLIKRLKLIEQGYITNLQAFAILVSALSHDIDHRGTNNRFQSCTNSDLFQLYNTQESILERHHLAITLSILRREDCNLIETLNSTDYKEFIELLTWNILATDISKYFQSRENNFKMLRDFKKGEKEYTFALLSLMMTACDVNDCVKNWEDNLISASQILSEFFDQGDVEKEMGMSPMAMMDRNLAYIPEVEFRFISGIVMPVYIELAAKFPDLQPSVKALRRCEECWEYSTIVFDAHPEVENKLDILKWPQMKEENLTKLGSNNKNFRRLSDEVTRNRDKRKSVQSSAGSYSKMDLRSKSGNRRTFVTKQIINPGSDFKRMFSDKDDEDDVVEDIFAEEEKPPRSCCPCLKKKDLSKIY